MSYQPTVDAFGIVESACSNRQTVEACNWESDADGPWCRGCAIDTTHEPSVLRQPFQRAKRRCLRQLSLLGVDVAVRLPVLQFDLRSADPGMSVVTGHQDGLITIDIAEAQPWVREEIRASLGESYRTPLGHVRHELGHWWWATAIGNEIDQAAFRNLFGDEQLDYSTSLERHYSSPDDGSWRQQFVSYYAASHPWEDFAESFAHVLHMHDTYETAVANGLVAACDFSEFDRLYANWVGLTLMMNEINRSMGTRDPYPFVVGDSAVQKIRAVAADLVH